MMHWLDSILSTDLSPLVESAFRSILLACLVAGGLKLLRVRNVVAQKAAWILVLGSAFAMPLLAPLALRMPIPAANAFHISWKRAVTSMPATSPAPSTAPVSTHAQVVKADRSQPAADASLPYAGLAPDVSEPTRTMELASQPEAQPAQARSHPPFTRAQFLFLLYCGVCATLLFRLIWGAALATRLWRAGHPVALANKARFAHLSVRSSERISSPLTIGSGILLPAGFAEWDAEKLRIVLAHEASHVRQRDFYLQLAAGLYSAIFWFIPLGWWLKRKLSDLSEAISDRAGLGEAANPVSYAQILIHFAALPHNPQIGVAMARQGRLTQRIERLLNESSFHDAFSATRIRNAAAMLVVPVALFAATALVRVQAAQVAPAPVVAPPLAAPQQKPAAPAREPNPAAEPQVIPPSAPEQPAEPAAVELTSPIRLQIPATLTISPDAPALVPDAPALIEAQQALIKAQTDKIRSNVLVAINAHALVTAKVQAQMARAMAENGPLGYWLGSNNDPYSIVVRSADSGTVHVPKNRTWHDVTMEQYEAEIDKAKAVTHGDFIWFRRDGKSYVIDDPSILAQIKPMQNQIDALGKQQEALGKQQEALGKQQEELGKQMEQVKVPTPNMQKELAKLQAAQAKLAAVQGKDASQEQLSEIQSELAEVQGRIGAIQGDMGGRMGEFGGKMGALGGQQGELGAKQGRLGAEQGRLARELDGKVLSLIDDCLKSGKAKPVK